MGKYIVELQVDTDAAGIEDSREAVNGFIRFVIHKRARLDSDEVFVFESREVE